MKPDIENIPSEIFDWVETRSFGELNSIQQKKVLDSMDREDYDELHRSFSFIIENTRESGSHFSSKEKLNEIFDGHHENKEPRFSLSESIIWKAACVFFICTTGWYFFKSKIATTASDLIVKTDTVFIEKNTAAAPKHDTFFIEKNIANKIVGTKTIKRKAENNKNANTAAPNQIVDKPMKELAVNSNDDDFQVLSVNTVKNVSNISKRNSMHDDSLEKNFKFVRL